MMLRTRNVVVPSYGNTLLGEYFYRAVGTTTWIRAKGYSYNPTTYGRPYQSVDRCVDELHAGPPYLSGGPLQVTKFKDGGLSLYDTEILASTSTREYRYVGAFLCALYKPSSFFGVSGIESPDFKMVGSEISAYGPTAWNRFKPGKPGADLALFVAELRDMPRMLRDTCSALKDAYKSIKSRNAKKSGKRLAGDYVGTQFGWLPFLADMRKFYHTWSTLDARIKQMQRDNGQWIKRGGTVLEESEEELMKDVRTAHAFYPTLPTFFYSTPTAPGWYRVTTHYERRIWFSARFRYYIPDIGSVRWKKKARRLLFGASVNPALLWEATPWSWLIDWASNVGDVLANLDNDLAENLTAKYAYIMGTTKKVGTVVSEAAYPSPLRIEWKYELETKLREEANPFGFGLTWDGLTSRQWSILAALGLDRLK